MRDLQLKLLSILIAVGLALFVNSESNTSVTRFVVPIEVKNLPTDLLIVRPQTLQAEVTIRGPSFLIARIYSAPPSLRVVVPENVGANFRAELRQENLSVPPSLRVLEIEPSVIDFVFDHKISKLIPVSPSKLGSLPKGYNLDALDVFPKEVTLTGAESEVKEIDVAKTQTVDLRGLTASEEREAGIDLVGRYLTVTPSTVKVKISISDNSQPKSKDKK